MTAAGASRAGATLRVAGGSFLAVLVPAVVGTVDRRPLLIAPFAASAALILAVPHVPLSRPRSIVSGYLMCTVSALALAATGLPAVWSQSVAVGLGVLGMQLTGTMHPPAAAVPVLVAGTEPTPAFLLTPVLLGAALLAGLAVLNRQWLRRRSAVDP